MAAPYLVLNAGSSSLKFAVLDPRSLAVMFRGQVANIGSPTAEFSANGQSRTVPAGETFEGALKTVMDWLSGNGLPLHQIGAVGHRLVHGGAAFTAPALVTEATLAELRALVRLAPLHMPFGLTVLDLSRAALPGAAQVACFDTAFHATQPEVATRLPLPAGYAARGYRRYGFHGLNYEHVVHALPRQTGQPLPKRLVAAHLGSGASVCAILEGRSVATSMGYSTCDGLVMGTRTGSIDPGVLIALLRDEEFSADALETLLYRQSGLLALSGLSADMRVLLESKEAKAVQAVEHYCYAAARHIASLLPALGGMDALAFTGGVGENAAPVRARILQHLAWLGLPAGAVHIVAADEELTIARHMRALLTQ